MDSSSSEKPIDIGTSSTLCMALILFGIILLIVYLSTGKNLLAKATEGLTQPTSHHIMNAERMRSVYYQVPTYVSPSTSSSIDNDNNTYGETSTNQGILTYRTNDDMFSGVRAKRSVVVGRVNSTCELYGVEMMGMIRDQGWGNYCGFVGWEVERNGQIVNKDWIQSNVPELRRGWLQLRYSANVWDTSGTQAFILLPGDVIKGYIQGPWPGCSSSVKHNFAWVFQVQGNVADAITPGS